MNGGESKFGKGIAFSFTIPEENIFTYDYNKILSANSLIFPAEALVIKEILKWICTRNIPEAIINTGSLSVIESQKVLFPISVIIADKQPFFLYKSP